MTAKEQQAYDEALRRIKACGPRGAELNLSSLGLTKLPPEIGQLQALTQLKLRHNQLSTLPQEIGQLRALTSLEISRNRLSKLPPEIGQLQALTELKLSQNQLSTLPQEIGQLRALTSLEISMNRLSELPLEIGQLQALTKLHIAGNKVITLPPEIGQLRSLTELYGAVNRLSTLPPEIGKLQALTKLSFATNQLKTLPPEIGQLQALTLLRLYRNKLSTLPPEIAQLPKLTELYLHDNPGLGLPAEVLGPTWQEVNHQKAKAKRPREILDYYFRIRPAKAAAAKRVVYPKKGQPTQPAVQVREARLIVIGDGAAGKTSLVRALLHGKPARKNEDTTRDVILEDWPGLELKQPRTRKKQRVTVHVWDFGGQEPMHAAHPYFFTNRTLYLVVATARETGVEDRIAYWLKMVAAHGQGARALVAVNKTDQHPMDITQRELCAAHAACLPANPKEAFYPTSCKTGKMKGIPALKRALLKEVERMEQVWTEVPGEWMEAKRLLEDRRAHDDDTLTFDEWHQLCDEAQVPAKERDRALNLLRDLGTVVSFPDDDHLSGLGVLNPSWVTRAIYPLLSSHELAEKGGLLQRSGLAALLDDAKRYPKSKHGWLIELMKKFELLFESEGKLLLPARLPKDAPEWACEARWSAAEALHLELRFAVLPESVISKFITRRHEDASRAESWWRHGIAIRDSSGRCEALVRAHVGDPGKIELRVLGPKVARQHFVAVLREDLRRLTLRLDGELWLVLEGVHPEKYDDLLLLAHEGNEREIKRVVNGGMRTFDLVKHLDLIESPQAQKEAVNQMNVVFGDAQGNAFGHGSRVRNQDSF